MSLRQVARHFGVWSSGTSPRKTKRANTYISVGSSHWCCSDGTDGHRTIGRPWHASPLNNSSQAGAMCSSTRSTLPLPHHEKIRLPPPLTIQGFFLCLATFILSLILVGC